MPLLYSVPYTGSRRDWLSALSELDRAYNQKLFFGPQCTLLIVTLATNRMLRVCPGSDCLCENGLENRSQMFPGKLFLTVAAVLSAT